MIEHLFGSKTRVKLLRLFFREPETRFYVREIARRLSVQLNAVRRELSLLIKAGLVSEVDAPGDLQKKRAGAMLRKYYLLNPESLLFTELQALMLKAQILGEQKCLEEIRASGGEIHFFLVTGRFTGDTSVQTDMMLVGEIREDIIEKLVKKYEGEFGFEIRYTIMSNKEFFDRREMMDKFLYSLFEAKHVVLVNDMGI